MYESYFDDDLEDITPDETLERAYALGVVSVCGDSDTDEYERLKRAAPDTYDESIIELAFDEGRAKALDLEAKEEESSTIWETLVVSELETPDVDSEDSPSGLPDALSRPERKHPSEGLPESLDIPSFLQR